MVELHMTFVPVPVIDCKEGNVKFQFPHKKPMEHFPRKKEIFGYDLPHAFKIT